MRRRKKVSISALSLLALLVFFWFSGAGARVLIGVAGSSLARSWGEGVVLHSIGYESRTPSPGVGITLTVHPERFQSMLEEAWPWAWCLPTRTVRDGLVFRGEWQPTVEEAALGPAWPVLVAIDGHASTHPKLVGRISATNFNQLIAHYFKDKLQTEEDWALGSYDLSYDLSFKTLNFHSLNKDLQQPVMQRRFALEATGRARVILDEGLITIRTTGKVRSLRGEAVLHVIERDDRLSLSYDVRFSRLDANFNNVAEYLDKKISQEAAAFHEQIY